MIQKQKSLVIQLWKDADKLHKNLESAELVVFVKQDARWSYLQSKQLPYGINL